MFSFLLIVLGVGDHYDYNKQKEKPIKKLLTVESLQEVRNKLKRLSDKSLYKDDALITVEMNGQEEIVNNDWDEKINISMVYIDIFSYIYMYLTILYSHKYIADTY